MTRYVIQVSVSYENEQHIRTANNIFEIENFIEDHLEKIDPNSHVTVMITANDDEVKVLLEKLK